MHETYWVCLFRFVSSESIYKSVHNYYFKIKCLRSSRDIVDTSLKGKLTFIYFYW